MIKKNMLTILKEAAEAEEFDKNSDLEYSGYVDDEELDLEDEISDEELQQYETDIIDTYEELEDIDDEELEYTEEMVTVIDACGQYLVEYDNLSKLITSKKYDAVTALEKISECNEIPLEEIVLVVESEDSIKSILQEKATSKKSKKKKLSALKSSSKLLKNIINKGIKVKKKCKSKKK